MIAIIVYFTMVSNLFWGNHDWGNIQKSIILNESLYECRFAATILQTIFCLKLIPYILVVFDKLYLDFLKTKLSKRFNYK